MIAEREARRVQHEANARAKAAKRVLRQTAKRPLSSGPQAIRRRPCDRCDNFVNTTQMIQPPEAILGMGWLCQPCWVELAVTFLPQEARALGLEGYYRRTYGLGFREYGDIYLVQHGRCKICGLVPTKPLVVDHDHETGRVRGLLCGTCNSGLGMFKDSLAVVARAVSYLIETTGGK